MTQSRPCAAARRGHPVPPAARRRLADLSAYRTLLISAPAEWARRDVMCPIPISFLLRSRDVRLISLPSCSRKSPRWPAQEEPTGHTPSTGCASGEEPLTLSASVERTPPDAAACLGEETSRLLRSVDFLISRSHRKARSCHRQSIVGKKSHLPKNLMYFRLLMGKAPPVYTHEISILLELVLNLAVEGRLMASPMRRGRWMSVVLITTPCVSSSMLMIRLSGCSFFSASS
jgi:hypothetical protein